MPLPSASPNNVEITYSNDFIDVQFSGMQNYTIANKDERMFTRDPVSNTLTDLGNTTETEPTEISITLDSSCGDSTTTTNLIDVLTNEFRRSTRESFSKGTLTIVDKLTGYVRTYGDAVLSKNPIGETSIDRGTQASYDIMFKCAREELNVT